MFLIKCTCVNGWWVFCGFLTQKQYLDRLLCYFTIYSKILSIDFWVGVPSNVMYLMNSWSRCQMSDVYGNERIAKILINRPRLFNRLELKFKKENKSCRLLGSLLKNAVKQTNACLRKYRTISCFLLPIKQGVSSFKCS